MPAHTLRGGDRLLQSVRASGASVPEVISSVLGREGGGSSLRAPQQLQNELAYRSSELPAFTYTHTLQPASALAAGSSLAAPPGGGTAALHPGAVPRMTAGVMGRGGRGVVEPGAVGRGEEGRSRLGWPGGAGPDTLIHHPPRTHTHTHTLMVPETFYPGGSVGGGGGGGVCGGGMGVGAGAAGGGVAGEQRAGGGGSAMFEGGGQVVDAADLIAGLALSGMLNLGCITHKSARCCPPKETSLLFRGATSGLYCNTYK